MGNDLMGSETSGREVTRAAVIVAAGKGLRAGTDVPKQYLPVGGKPMLRHSVETFLAAGADPVVIVIPAGDEAYVREEILAGPDDAGRIVLVSGGAERHDSVYEGLKACADSDYVWIHDAARPFVTPEILDAAMAAAEECGAAVPVIPVKDTVYVRGDAGDSGEAGETGAFLADIPARDTLCAAQTPQTFRTDLILRAHEWYRGLRRAEKAALKVTDDAMLARAVGAEVKLVPGSSANLKVTTPEDVEYLRRGGC